MTQFSNKLPALFGAALVINLPERTDRLHAMNAEFKAAGWDDFRVVPGIKFDDAAGFKSTAWRGCFHAHFACLKIAHAENLDSVLIFEDDIVLTRAFPNLMPSIIGAVRELPWDYLYFGHEETGDIPRASRTAERVTFEKPTKEFVGGHFYAVRKRILPRLIAHFERLANGQPGDHDFGPMLPDGAHNTFRRHNRDVQTFIANPKLGWQSSSRSDITPRAIDSIQPLRPLISVARRIKRIVQRI
jgi:glycosyl transferase family 25